MLNADCRRSYSELMCLCCAFEGAYGFFEVTHDITKYCKAKIFEHIGKKTPIFVRFSTVGEILLFFIRASCFMDLFHDM